MDMYKKTKHTSDETKERLKEYYICEAKVLYDETVSLNIVYST